MKNSSPSAAAGSVLGASSLHCNARLLLAACGGGGSSSPDAQQQFGRLTLRITDSPVTSAKRVVVQFTGLEIKPRGAAATRSLRLRAAADRSARARWRRQRNPAVR